MNTIISALGTAGESPPNDDLVARPLEQLRAIQPIGTQFRCSSRESFEMESDACREVRAGIYDVVESFAPPASA